jgi:4-hydroxy-tetrahydrodipicolinate synthase
VTEVAGGNVANNNLIAALYALGKRTRTRNFNIIGMTSNCKYIHFLFLHFLYIAVDNCYIFSEISSRVFTQRNTFHGECSLIAYFLELCKALFHVHDSLAEHAVEKARAAEQNGANALLAVTPYYNKCTPSGLVRHYREIASATSLPIIVYTVPSRTGMTIPPSVWGELFAIPNIIGIKDATGDIAYGAQFLSCFGNESCLWSGNDNATLPLLSLGSEGVISVLSNVKPKGTSALCHTYAEGKIREAKELAASLLPLADTLFCEVNPIPVKAALSLMGICKPYCRLPLTTASEGTFNKLKILL